MPTKTYTAQEMREAADNFWVGGVICEVRDGQGRVVKQIKDDVVIAMLRQAADAEEELAKVKAQFELWKTNSQRAIDALSKELNSTEANKQKLKARLDAVVKEIESRDWINDVDLADAILRVARGEGGAE